MSVYKDLSNMLRTVVDRKASRKAEQTPRRSDVMSFFVIEMNMACNGMLGLSKNYTIMGFDPHSVLEFTNFRGRNIMELDENLESVVDTGRSLKFQFFGGGTLTIDGLTGYHDFTSLALDYMVLLSRKG
jgi:hypothetical protein